MKLFRYLVVTSLLIGASPVFAARNFDFFVQPQISTAYGYNKYVYDQTGYFDEGRTILGHAKSELDFPIDATHVGIGIGLRARDAAKTFWSVEGTVRINLGNARKPMRDHDWLDTVGAGGGKFSYTESQSDLHNFSFSIEGKASFVRAQKLCLGGVAGLLHTRAQQNLNDAIGWQYAGDSIPADLNIYGLVGKYRVTWDCVYLGVFWDYSPVKNVQLGLTTAFAPTWVNDRDDHLLRNFYTQGSANGSGFIARGRIEFRLQRLPSGPRPILELAADYHSLAAKGSESMNWYGDDPASPGDDTGQSVHGVPHQFTSRQIYLSLQLGLLF
ncbi:MAG: omptin family outer membrane protease [Candidatus Zixiibacteriota bacterium]